MSTTAEGPSIAIAPPTSPVPAVTAMSELKVLRDLTGRVERECPRRASASPDELRAQEILAEQFSQRGLEIRWQRFRASTNLYAVLALHKALAVLGSVVSFWMPVVGAALHLIAGVSYVLDCHYGTFLLRRLLGTSRSQNLIARLPAEGEPRHRVVLVAHADSAPTGWMFHPAFLHLVHRFAPRRSAVLRKHMFAWVVSLLALVGLTVIRTTTDWWWFPGWYWGLTLGSAIPLVLMLQIVLTNRIVPGANDNLSGCAALVLLADRFAHAPLSGVELVFVVTGCEESGRGGSLALAREMRGEWDPADTTCLVLDMLSGGQLRYHVEGEIWPLWPSRRIVDQLHRTAARDDRFAGLRPYHAPAGATDAAPLLLHGFNSVCLSRIDDQSDLPADYHGPADHIGNLRLPDILSAVDFTEQLVLDLHPRS